MGSTLGSTRTLSKHPFSAQKGRRLVNVTRYQRPPIGGSYQGLGGEGLSAVD
jgi:hypothetical protein